MSDLGKGIGELIVLGMCAIAGLGILVLVLGGILLWKVI